MPGNALQIGTVIGSGKPLLLPASARERHLYICGGTGVGKSKFLEHCIRQDILNWTDSGCGLILFDPHGLVYENTMAWLARHGLKRPVVPIDLRRDDWIISYNLLRQRKESDPAVVVANFVRALAHVWGAGDTDQTPLFAKWASVIFLTLYHNGYTIADVMHLIGRQDIRRAMIGKVHDDAALHAWKLAESRPKEFEQQITSTLNRFQRLLGPQIMRATLGQPHVSLDLLAAINEGKIILVNLSTQGGKIDEEDADTYATLLLTDLWSAAKARGKGEREKTRPFYVYIDECQNFVTPTIAKNLDQARGFGLHLTLANQFPSQILNAGQSGKMMYDSILANTGTKIVFRTEHPEDIKPLAQQLFMRALDTDLVKLKLMSTKVVGYREEERESYTTGTSTGSSRGRSSGQAGFSGESAARSEGGSESFGPEDEDHGEPLGAIEAWNTAAAQTHGNTDTTTDSESESESTSESVTRSSVLIPIMGKEVSSVQYRSVDEQLFRAMQLLFDQEDRHFAVRYPGGPKTPMFVKTPTIASARTDKKAIEAFRKRLLKKLPFAMPMAEATKHLDGRQQKLLTDVVDVVSSEEPTITRRRIK